MYYMSATCFGLYNAIIRDVVHKGIRIQQILWNVCMLKVKTEYFVLELSKMCKLSVNYKLFVFLNTIFLSLATILYEVCSNSIRFGIVVVVHWVGFVCNQSRHVRTCLSNSRHKLQVAAFAQLAVVGRGSNTCVYVIQNFTTCESTNNAFASSFVLKLEKPQRKSINYCSKHRVKMQWVVHKCLSGSVDLKRVEPPLKATPARDDRQHRETRK